MFEAVIVLSHEEAEEGELQLYQHLLSVAVLV